ncbi:DUF5345 family protein [Clostridium cadaveris]|uniref:YxlC family protein n=1 Tax=Clostridium cadaveris TaxID=1529 RepID=A0A1I2JSX0_9CLOT|nr:DUF5345 family protein [Clostridium cadaveris]NME64367.1 YxlC family protein [Clostridium cadaveris]NWK12009.1 DUF5345 family protein [Clostridium cadaveris]PWL53191.1 MAG: hypothetical protein DBY38_08475 [Clostridium cadaveris]UFH63942.1 YxlC family protein [Clostridium cadaveris]SFF57674.1 hypothetical protein SAMN04487885_10376 [Clostridium cadaveris]
MKKSNNKDFKNQLTNSFSEIDDLNIDTPNLEYFSSLVREEKVKIEKVNNKQFALFLICAIVIASISISMFLYYTEVFMKLHLIFLSIPLLFLLLRLLLNSKETIK